MRKRTNVLAQRFGQVLRNVREASGLSKPLLAQRVGIDDKYLDEIERGDVVPTAALLANMAKQYDCFSFDFMEALASSLQTDPQLPSEVMEPRAPYQPRHHRSPGAKR